MYTRLDRIPTLQTRTEQIEPRCYNSMRLGLIRYGAPLRLELAGLRGMDIIIDRERWACVDRTLFDLPVIAWDRFDNGGDDTRPLALHRVITCRVRHYHFDAGHIGSIVLASAVHAIGDLFERHRPRHPATVLHPFPPFRLTDALIRSALLRHGKETARDDETTSSDSTPASG